MKKITICLMIFLGLVYGYKEIKISNAQATKIGITNIPLQGHNSSLGIPFNAVIDFDDKASIAQSSTFDVVVVAIYKREGEIVESGDDICEISSNELSNLNFELKNTSNKYRIAKEVADKDKSLYNSGVISQREYQNSFLAAQELSLKIEQLKSTFRLFGIDPERPVGRSGFRVVAKENGILAIAPKYMGEKIQAFTPYVRIAKGHKLLARIRVPISMSDYVVKGAKVYNESQQYIGDISSVAVVVDKTNNSVIATANLNDNTTLKVGEIVDLHIKADQPKGTFTIPSKAIIKNEKDDLIFIKTKNGYLPKAVKVTQRQSNSFIIESGDLKGNEQIAMGALIALKGLVNNVGSNEGQ